MSSGGRVCFAVLLATSCSNLVSQEAPTLGSEATSVSSLSVSEHVGVGLQRWVEHVAYMSEPGSIWRTSNDLYQAQDGASEYFMRFDSAGGGLAMIGCLWGRAGNRSLPPLWVFFAGWDPVSKRGVLYQASPAGAVGFGHWLEGTSDQPSTSHITIRHGDGEILVVRHEHLTRVADVTVDTSYEQVDGDWERRRQYTWTRQPAESDPC